MFDFFQTQNGPRPAGMWKWGVLFSLMTLEMKLSYKNVYCVIKSNLDCVSILWLEHLSWEPFNDFQISHSMASNPFKFLSSKRAFQFLFRFIDLSPMPPCPFSLLFLGLRPVSNHLCRLEQSDTDCDIVIIILFSLFPLLETQSLSISILCSRSQLFSFFSLLNFPSRATLDRSQHHQAQLLTRLLRFSNWITSTNIRCDYSNGIEKV